LLVSVGTVGTLAGQKTSKSEKKAFKKKIFFSHPDGPDGVQKQAKNNKL